MNFSYEDLEILFEDKNIIVVKKPAGVPSESAEVTRPDMVRTLKNYLSLKEGGKDPYLALLHRLDQPVEGIMVFGKNREAAARLSEDIQKERLQKEYLAASYPMKNGLFAKYSEKNGVSGTETLLEDYLLKGSANMVKVVPRDTPRAKPARLYYLPFDGSYTVKGGQTQLRLIRIRLLTGRHHQIRVQLAHTGLPIVGDRKYGCMPDDYDGPLCLAATGLSFIHPKTRENMHFEISPGFMEALEPYTESSRSNTM